MAIWRFIEKFIVMYMSIEYSKNLRII